MKLLLVLFPVRDYNKKDKKYKESFGNEFVTRQHGIPKEPFFAV